MTQYIIWFDAHAMGDVPDGEMSAVADAAHDVVKEIFDAGAYVLAGGVNGQWPRVVALDGSDSESEASDAVGGLTVIDVATREEAQMWAGKIAVACRRPQEIGEIGRDPLSEEMLRGS